MAQKRIAVLMTCHNRKSLTHECLNRLIAQEESQDVETRVFLVDDGSSDGTASMVNMEFPQVEILEGDGSLFWCGGMRLAFGEALKHDFDFYLWLNDDTMLLPGAIKTLLETHYELAQKSGQETIVVGSLCDKDTGELTYGGRITRKWWQPAKNILLQPGQGPQQCDVFNGNCVLIPAKIAKTVGNMSEAYKHGPGDRDYALRAAKSGFSSWICPGFIGECRSNNLLEKWRNKALTMDERVEALNHPVIIARVEDWIVYVRKYHKLQWPVYYLRSLIRLRFPRLYILLKTFSLLNAKAQSNYSKRPI